MRQTTVAEHASPAAAARKRVSFGSPLTWFVDLLFGYDYFISYAHRDGPQYPARLAERLQARGFRTFLDTREYVAGIDLNAATKRRVRMSRYLLVIARPEAFNSVWVRKEVEACLAAGRTPIVIDVNGEFERTPPEAPLKKLLRNRLFIKEQIATIDAPPSDLALKEIRRSFKSVRQETLRLRIMSVAAGVFAVVAAIAIWQYFLAEERRKTALARQLAVQAQLLLTEDPTKIERSILLAIESMRRRPTLEGDMLLRQISGILPAPLLRLEHPETVDAVVFHPAGTSIATACADGKIRIWEAANGRLLRSMDHARLFDNSIAFSADGKFLFSGGGDGFLRKWNADTGAEEAKLPVEDFNRSSLAKISPDGRFFVTLDQTENFRVRETSTGDILPNVTGLTGHPFFAFSPDGNFFLSLAAVEAPSVPAEENWSTDEESFIAEQDSATDEENSSKVDELLAAPYLTAQVRKLPNGEKVGEVKTSEQMLALALSPEGSHMLYSAMDGTVRAVKVENGVEVAKMPHGFVITHISVSSDGRFVGTVDDAGTARVWTGANGQEIFRRSSSADVLPGEFKDEVMVFSPDGKRFATSTLENLTPDAGTSAAVRAGDLSFRSTVWIWSSDIAERAGYRHGGKAEGYPLSRNGKLIATADALRDNIVRVTEMDTHGEVAQVAHEMRVTRVAISPDQKYLATASWDGTAGVFALPGGKEIARLKHGDRVNAVAFSADSSHLATASDDQTIRVWTIPDGRESFSIKLQGATHSIALNANETLLASEGPGNRVQIYDLVSKREKTSFEYPGALEFIEFSPDGRYLAAGGREKEVFVRQTCNGKVVAKVSHEGRVRAGVFSADSRFLATASDDTTCRVWEVKSGREIIRLNHGAPVSAVTFTADSKTLITNAEILGPGAVTGGFAKVWPWQRDDVIKAATVGVLHNLSKADWLKFIGPEEKYRKTIPGLDR